MVLSHEIQGFFPWWILESEVNLLRYDLLSTINWFSLEPTTTGAIGTRTGYPPTSLITKAHQNGVRVNLVVQTFDNAIQDAILASNSVQNTLINNALSEVQTHNFDGIDFDFELIRGTNAVNNQPNRGLFTNFIRSVNTKFKAANPNYQIMLDLPPVDWNNIFDVVVLQDLVTYMEIMGYDFHWQGGPTAGSVAPLDSDGTAPSVRNAVNNYKALVSPQKLLLGIPYYGYEWQTVSDAREASTTDNGVAYRYYEALARAALYGRRFDSVWKTPYYQYQTDSQWHQGHYDDAESLGLKYDLVKSSGLRGISIWALGYDSGKTELWDLIHSKFTSAMQCSFNYSQ